MTFLNRRFRNREELNEQGASAQVNVGGRWVSDFENVFGRSNFCNALWGGKIRDGLCGHDRGSQRGDRLGLSNGLLIRSACYVIRLFGLVARQGVCNGQTTF